MEELKVFDIIYADLSGKTIGSEQAGIRPCVVFQNDMGNHFCPTVLVFPLTKQIKKAEQPTHCIIKKNDKNGLTVDSMVLGEAYTSISKDRIIKKIGYIDNPKEQNDIVNVYLANAIGNKNNPGFNGKKIIFMMLKSLMGGNYGKSSTHNKERRCA